MTPHADTWWAPRLRDRLTRPSELEPWRLTTLRITAPSGWLGPLTPDVFRSRAY